MDDRISSIDGSLVAGLFIETPLHPDEGALHRKMRRDSSRITLTAEPDLREVAPPPTGRLPQERSGKPALIERPQLLPDVLDLGDVVLSGLNLDVEAEIRRGQVTGGSDQCEGGNGLAGVGLDQPLADGHDLGL